MKNELVQTTTQDDFILSGLYTKGDLNKTAVILIHGFTGDFYSHKFGHSIQERLQSLNTACVSIQTRGTGLYTEFNKSNRLDGQYIGSYYERLSEAHLDISAWIEFLKSKGYSKFILAGHSLGTIKTVRYLFEGKYSDLITKIVLLAPFDKNGYIERLIPGKRKEFIEQAKAKVAEGKGEEIVPDGWEDYPISYQTYISWYEDTDLSNMWDFHRYDSYDFPIMKKISIPTQIIVGDNDEYFYIPEFMDLDTTKKVLKDSIKDLDLNIITGSEHCYVGFENEVAKMVSKFVEEGNFNAGQAMGQVC